MGGGVGWGRVDVEFWTFMGGGYQNGTSASKGGWESKLWSFHENVIIECPLTSLDILGLVAHLHKQIMAKS